MSTLTSNKPISVVIFDRTQAGLSDVPIFAQSLKEKVNTPTPREVLDEHFSANAIKILEQIQSKEPTVEVDSVLRADSSGGQTGEFAQNIESERLHSLVLETSVQKNETKNQDPVIIVDFAEEPIIIRPQVPRLTLNDVIDRLETVKIAIPTLRINPLQTTLLERHHHLGFLERIVLPAQSGELASETLELVIYTVRRFLRVTGLVLMRTQSKVASLSLPNIPTLPTLSFPTISLPTLEMNTLRPRFNFARFTSRILIAGSLVLMLMTVGPMIALEMQSWAQKISYAVTNIHTRADDEGDTTALAKPTPIPTVNPDPEKQFQIIIPKLGVNSKVIANVDPASETEYSEALKKGVAHAAGTGLPGEVNSQNKTIFIFGHSTNGEWNIARYNALFYALKDLVVDDTFSVWFWGKEYHYKVSKTEIVAADDVSFLIPQTAKDQLILQTCWPPGTSWKRFLVIAEPIQ